jgi:FkbM family methyltransferase
MIFFKHFTDNNDGLFFESKFLYPKKITLKIIEPYSQLCLWSDSMEVGPGTGNFFFSRARNLNSFGFEIVDTESNEIYLKLQLNAPGYCNLEESDKFGKLNNYKYSEKNSDSFAALSLDEIFALKVYDHPHCRVEKNDVVVDIGANLGFFSYYAILHEAQIVYAFEPGPNQARAILENFGDLGKIKVEQKAVSDTNGFVIFSPHTISVLSQISKSSDDQKSNSCESVNLFDYCKEHNIPKINFLKLDCEGSEWQIFESLSDDFIANIDKIALEYHLNTDGRVDFLVERLRFLGFEVEISGSDFEVGYLFAFKNILLQN